MNIFNRAPQQNKQEAVVEKIDELATELEVKRMRLYEERFSANTERTEQINKEMKILEDNLATLKRAKKIPNMEAVRKALSSEKGNTATEEDHSIAFNNALRATGEYQAADRIGVRTRTAEEALKRAEAASNDPWSQGRGFDSPDGKRGNV